MSAKWSVKTQLPVHYTVFESFDLFNPENNALLFDGQNSSQKSLRRVVIVDDYVERLHGERIRQYFQYHEIEYRLISLSVSEDNKSMDTVFQVIEELNAFEVSRRSEPVIAIGGGVLMDIVGLAANLFRRGIPYIRVPTTLLGVVDAAIGAKTAVNFQGHKNRIGTFYPPLAAILDTTLLETLSDRQISNGIAEILKIALVKDAELFELLENYGAAMLSSKCQNPEAVPIIRRSVQGMLEDLESNLWEEKLERLVDYGHTFCPTLELKAVPKLLHGEAVAVDMAISVMLAYQRSLVTYQEVERIYNFMRSVRLPLLHPICTPELLYAALQSTTKHRNGLQRFPLTVGIGAAQFFHDITYEEIKTAVKAIAQLEPDAAMQTSPDTLLNGGDPRTQVSSL
ncbi:3-dehydroquinate synthase [Gloeocapsa sp. PCC 7428]|uniref:sedoheptulose 7-phosphate cyclase n=1 Tax=Gloeocapsa sp. PCC 7428 TaxID=1173026 RepID=UPI0002A6187F|nr:sedoheptulose 7-phosphate cyclase [Gloeocapsa sp. PCC 7428]AFZ29122.1 3-dehydroquinate synthase [Gloeocapsa sp. PCC 7428]